MAFKNIANETQFTDQIAHGATIAVFGASWCKACRATKKALGEFAAAYPRIACVFVDIDELPLLAGPKKIENIPTLFIYRDGRQRRRTVGQHSLTELKCWALDQCDVE